MPGLLNSFGIDNGFTDFLASHRNALAGLGQGIASGTDLGRGIALGAQGAIQGRVADDAYATTQKAEKDRVDAINKTAEFLRSKGRADLIPLLDAGQGNIALQQAFAPPKAPIDPTSTYQGRLDAGKAQGLTGRELATYALTSNIPGGGSSSSTSDIQNYEYGLTHPEFASQQDGQSLSPESLDLIATQYLAGDKSAIVGFARNANMKAKIANAISEKANAMGMDGKAIAAEVSAYGGNVAAQRSAGTRAAQVGMAASEANQMADIALEASKAVPRDNLVPWNSVVQAVQKGTSSPEMAQFVTATTSLVNAYARAISPLGAPTDAMRQHAEEMLNTAQGPEAYAAVIAQMKKEMEAALNAPAEISDRLKASVTGGGDGASQGSGKVFTYNPATGELE